METKETVQEYINRGGVIYHAAFGESGLDPITGLLKSKTAQYQSSAVKGAKASSVTKKKYGH